MSTLNDLLRQVEKLAPELAAELTAEVKALQTRRAFGLNFERHTPETVELPDRPVRRGDKVRFLPERCAAASTVDDALWRVHAIRKENGSRVAELTRRTGPEAQTETTHRDAENLVVVAEFRDPIYPGLASTGTVERGGDKPFHTVINAENFHALQALIYTHEGVVDVIYIDPPYNTGAKDWKYNNDYVDGEDVYRHSKWLAFMERRLKIAKALLNPEDSVLIVAVDENESLRLGLLLEQTFPDARMQMVTIVINPSGASGDGFSRVEEHLFFVRYGTSVPAKTPDNLLTDIDARDGRVKGGLSWESFLRSGVGNTRAARPNLCYPILIDEKAQRIVGAGDPLVGSDDARPLKADGHTLAWPVRNDGSLGMWRRDPDGLRDLVSKGYAYVSKRDKHRGTWSLKYLLSGTIAQITAGDIEVEKSGERGQVVATEESQKQRVAKTVWNRASHNAGKHGSDLIRTLLPNRRFPFPKALYAVEDALRFFVKDKPNAVVLDFFSGSGTTAHAVMRLNRQDDGRRQCISVTNNEVAADEQASLRKQGLRPGDSEWEQRGICDYITKPRINAAITGETPDGEPIKGDYKFTDKFPMADGFEENVEFFTMTYEAPRRVAHHRSFPAIAPLLWLRAGSQGRRIERVNETFDIADTYGVLFDSDENKQFVAALRKKTSARMAFIVTDNDRAYQSVCKSLPGYVEPVRLYASYLTSFTINKGTV